MKFSPSARLLPLVFLGIVGCGSESPSDHPHPTATPTPEIPVVFNLDRTTPLPLVSVLATSEEAARLRTLYASFLVQMAPPRLSTPLSLRFDSKGSLGIPWNFYLRNFASPYPVRLIGVLANGKREIIHEETY
jgi:hypothetical protein